MTADSAPVIVLVSKGSWPLDPLSGRGADVVVTADLERASRHVEALSPRVVITSLSAGAHTALELLALFARRRDAPGVIVTLEETELRHTRALREAGALALVGRGDTRDLVRTLAPLGVIRTSMVARAGVHLPAELRVGDDRWPSSTKDLRATGVALRGLPDLEPGLPAEVTLALPQGDVTISAQTVRATSAGGTYDVALRFRPPNARADRSIRQMVAELSLTP